MLWYSLTEEVFRLLRLSKFLLVTKTDLFAVVESLHAPVDLCVILNVTIANMSVYLGDFDLQLLLVFVRQFKVVHILVCSFLPSAYEDLSIGR